MNTRATKSIRSYQARVDRALRPATPITTRELPPTLQYRIAPGSRHNIVVNTDEHVHTGQTLVAAIADGPASIHAGSSGTITCKQTDSEGHTTIEIATDGYDSRRFEQAIGDKFRSMSSVQLQQLFHHNGLVGLGGACFPVAGKIAALESKPASVLLVNAVECDPAILCDRALLLEQASAAIRGIGIAAHACNAQKVIIAIKNDEPAIHTAVQNALEKNPVENSSICKVAADYPVGYERYLFASASEIPVPENTHPTALGLISFNVATCIAIAQLIDRGEPLFSRVTTVHKPTTGAIQNLHIRFGTPLNHLVQGSDTTLQSVAYSGLITENLPSRRTATISPASNCVILNPEATTQNDCIRCGLCADVCPASLQPQQLLTHSEPLDAKQLARHQLDRCIECGCCDTVCPSGIPLTRTFQQAMQAIHQQTLQIQAAERAKQRFAARQNRLERQSAESQAKLARKQAALTQRTKQSTPSADPRKQLLESALRRRSKKPKTDNTPPPP